MSNGRQEYRPGSNTLLRLTPGFLTSAMGVCRSSEAGCSTFTADVLCDLGLPRSYLYSICIVMPKILAVSPFEVQHHLVVPSVGQRWLAAKFIRLVTHAHHEDLYQLVRLKIYWAQAFPQKTNCCIISQIHFELNRLRLKRVGCTRRLVDLRRFCCGRERTQGSLNTPDTCPVWKMSRAICHVSISLMSDRPVQT